MTDRIDDALGITIRHLSKSFGRTKVLDNINLDIRAGEFFSLLGPSGCGKTTLLNILGGLEPADSGTVMIGSEDVTGLPPERRPTNMVFQTYAMFPHLSVGRNVAYGLRRKRLGRRERSELVERMLELVHLGGMGGRDPAELSGGQRQRVALARALVMEPKVLLLDESLAALDKRLREAMQLELRELQRHVGITFVFVTHDQDEAMAMSDRIAVMGRGEILQVNTPTELYHNPVNREVAGFIGSINLFPARRDGGAIEAGALGRFEACGLPTAERGLYALRPEAIRVSPQRADEAAPTVGGRVIDTTFLGDRSFVRVALEGRDEPVTVACTDRIRCDLAPGQTVWLAWSLEEGRLIADR